MIIVRPDAYRQYPAGHSRFTLVLERRFSDDVRIEPPSRYETWDTVAVEPGRSLADVLRSDVPQDGDVLVVAEDDRLLTAPDSEVGPHRTVAALRAGTGPSPSTNWASSSTRWRRPTPAPSTGPATRSATPWRRPAAWSSRRA
ncbi:hypothetical protein [Streptomyces sudanensis]|uniref:hypothetical protein n=1 Tax=Streptomyces sudanensis TaxID=436397 RepID=UPI0020CFA934|nr:hypothetical protein [Streptomyces sudanensis]MCQ0002677.1 hypothetical protein [Streptomyces sudanensis]